MQNNSRRDFIKKTVAAGSLLGLTGIPMSGFAKSETKITLLHTNDVHSHIEPFPDNDPKHPGLGGIARRASLINQIRNEEDHVILLDAGDSFQGTPYFNMYGGELEFKLMSKMGYDATTIGNHDFDNGIDGLVKQMHHANFPFICSNYDFKGTNLENKTIRKKIIYKGGIKIGIFGLGVELEGLVDTKLYGNTKYLDPIEIAAEMTNELKNKDLCDLVICLSHLGDEYRNAKVSDEVLAKKSRNIDIIIGGHTHKDMETPVKHLNLDGKEVYVNQVGWAGIKLGRIDFYFKGNKKKGISVNNINVHKNNINIINSEFVPI